MRDAIAAETGVEITDTDGDGFADTNEQVAAIYTYVKANPVVNDQGVEIFTISRSPARGDVRPVSAAQLEEFASVLRARTGIEARVFA